MLLSGCFLQPGYHWSTVGNPYVQVPDEFCKNPEMSSADIIQRLNSTKGQPDGVPHTVIGIRNTADSGYRQRQVDLSFPEETPDISCRATLIFTHHHTESGVFSMHDQSFGNPDYQSHLFHWPWEKVPITIIWRSDAEIAAHREVLAKQERILQESATKEDAAATIHIPSHCKSKLAYEEELVGIPEALYILPANETHIIDIKTLQDTKRLKFMSVIPPRFHYFLSCPLVVKWSNGNLQFGYFFTIWHDPNGQTMVYYGHHEYIPGSRP